MRRTGTLALTALTVLAACADKIGSPTPGPPTRPLTFSLCGAAWGAYQNDGGEWTRVTAVTTEIQATERLAIATARVVGETQYTTIAYLGADQVASLFRCGGGSPPSTRSNSRSPSAPAGSHDLIAARWPPYTIAWHADRLIIRRAQDYPTGVVPVIDFESAESFPIAENVLSWTGPGAHVQVNFQTRSGNDHLLSSDVIGQSGSADEPRTAALYSIPESRLADGDMHPSSPTFTAVATTPHLRYRVDVPALADHAANVYVRMWQRDASTGFTDRVIEMYGTDQYFGDSPSGWSLAIPDLAGVSGSASLSLGLKPGSFQWSLVMSGRPLHFQDADATDGLTHRIASRLGEHEM